MNFKQQLSRTLMVAGVNALLDAGKLSLEDLGDNLTGEYIDHNNDTDSCSVEMLFDLDGLPCKVRACCIGHGEVTIYVWYGIGSGKQRVITKCNMLVSAGTLAVARGWLERRNGKYIQTGKDCQGITSYISKAARPVGVPDVTPNGFKANGPFHM